MVYDFRATTGSQSNIEHTGEREIVYNLWHRQFPGLGFVDIDHVEMCKRCQQPLALIETARDTGIALDYKKAHVTQNIARRLGIPAGQSGPVLRENPSEALFSKGEWR